MAIESLKITLGFSTGKFLISLFWLYIYIASKEKDYLPLSVSRLKACSEKPIGMGPSCTSSEPRIWYIYIP